MVRVWVSVNVHNMSCPTGVVDRADAYASAPDSDVASAQPSFKMNVCKQQQKKTSQCLGCTRDSSLCAISRRLALRA